MNFNFGDVLARAGQITWKYKILWLAGILISMASFLTTPISLLFNPSATPLGDASEAVRQLPSFLIVNGLVMLISILFIPLYVIGLAVPSLGTLQVERGNEKLNFGDLIKASLPYFWRILGIFLAVWVGMFLAIAVFVGCIAGLSVATFGIGAICAVPFVILLIPLMMLMYAVMEQAMAAVLLDNLGFSSALQRGWDLVKKNLGVMALMTITIYLGSMIVSMVVSIPMMIPMFSFFFDMMQSEPDIQELQNLSRNMVWWMLAFSPLYAVLQGILWTFMQSAWTLTYLRLTRSQDNTPVIIEANA